LFWFADRLLAMETRKQRSIYLLFILSLIPAAAYLLILGLSTFAPGLVARSLMTAAIFMALGLAIWRFLLEPDEKSFLLQGYGSLKNKLGLNNR